MRVGYRLTVSPERGDEYKLVWGDHNSDLQPYCVSGTLVVRAGEQVRTVLNQISGHYRECEVLGSKASYDRFFPALTAAGAALSEAILQRTSGDQTAAAEAQTLIRSIDNQVPLTIVVSGTPLHVPWGFLFRGDLDELPTLSGTMVDFADFWTNIFDINVSYSRTAFFNQHPRRKSSGSFVMHALHDQHFNAARSQFDDAENVRLETLLKMRIGNFTDWQACRINWRKSEDVDSIIYVFGHSDGQSIYLANNTEDAKFKIDASGFSASFKKKSGTTSSTICFLNGCRSGAGLLGSSFLGVTAGQGFHGFIGSEAELSNTFAARYGAAFMSGLCIEGYSVQEALFELRQRPEFFPLSLLYTCYAQPDFRLPLNDPSRNDASSGDIQNVD